MARFLDLPVGNELKVDLDRFENDREAKILKKEGDNLLCRVLGDGYYHVWFDGNTGKNLPGQMQGQLIITD
jgi:hypothetical protein